MLSRYQQIKYLWEGAELVPNVQKWNYALAPFLTQSMYYGPALLTPHRRNSGQRNPDRDFEAHQNGMERDLIP